MGRGLGEMQRTVLELLREAGEPCAASYLAGMMGQPSHALDVSVRRAVRTLRRRGIVDCALARGRLVAWLPEHEPPMVHRRVSGDQIEALVLERLREWTGWYPVYTLTQDIGRQLGVGSWLAKGVLRAARRLRERGVVYMRRERGGSWRIRMRGEHRQCNA